MKSKFFLMRISADEKKQIEKAARNSKSVAAFLLSAAQTVIRYRREIEQIKTIDRECKSKNIKMPKLEVRVK
jgi:uncharacterized protein (DUF1778 family)